MQARGFLIDRLKDSSPRCTYCVYQQNELKREIKKKTGGGKQGAKQKSGEGHCPPRPPLRIATGPDQSLYNPSRLWSRLQTTL